MKSSGQKFIARNRAPRVQIEYDVELYGSEKAVQLPFIMGVIADLAGKPEEALPDVNDRKFLEIDVDNFDERMSSVNPRVAFQVDNTLTGEGKLNIDLTFKNMEDFQPDAIAKNVEPLAKLLEARVQLANLLSYMDGKDGAEKLISEILQNPALLQSLAEAPNPENSASASGTENSTTEDSTEDKE
ncbi:type VI secretion system contractile sheath small subunit [Xenorhabdus sp. Reich]|uniref:Type VI secretion system contractile sheath small subunit n=1 Tax=Xenorhabdus littoralis TaxID=2582835 RepID=A0ABU4SI17_9GAMM|nr:MULTISPECIES: type VI secretion system contractile sheath small subunit [unclassified Xenorhabdus]MDX7989784.1 type VI secretion system contractile sheath small subunit [Xenorhabdus sp. psl]MDX7998297.1 type VI secretion system contractile sheath small subunit [Xenorhabdus sp. Reich]